MVYNSKRIVKQCQHYTKLAEIPVIGVEDSDWDDPDGGTSGALREAAQGSNPVLSQCSQRTLVRLEAKETSATNQPAATQSQVS